MIKILFKYVKFGGKFIHKDVEYTKTNFSRGYYYKDGVKVLKRFKKRNIVYAKETETTCEILPKGLTKNDYK